MNKNLENSKTKENLLQALSGEAIAANKYLYFAKKARKDGYIHIAEIFEKTAANEKEHAKIWFELLYGKISSVKENLKSSIENERYEWSQMYKEFASTALEEGFEHISKLFSSVAGIEKTHDERYSELLDNLLNNETVKKDKEVTWVCSKCGYQTSSKEAPDKCPVCEHPKNYFWQKCEKF